MERTHKRKSMFWGVFFVILGVSLLIQFVFHINLPIFRILFASFIIYVGVKMLIGSFNVWSFNHDERATVFSKKDITIESIDDDHDKNYSVIFGDSEIDLTKFDEQKLPAKIEINVVFGQATVILRKGMAVKIKSDAVFADARMPDDNFVTFGGLRYTSPEAKSSDKILSIRGNAVFGSLRFHYEDMKEAEK